MALILIFVSKVLAIEAATHHHENAGQISARHPRPNASGYRRSRWNFGAQKNRLWNSDGNVPDAPPGGGKKMVWS